MQKVLLTGSSFTAPKDVINNEELVRSFNTYVQEFNRLNAEAIVEGKLEALKESSVEFIEKASGIKNRHVIDKKSILDPNIMQPILPERTNDQISLQAEMAVEAGKLALARANKKPEEVDVVILSCSNFQRAYPAVSIEVQAALGCKGFAYDMNVACSSATFGLQAGADAVRSGSGKVALVINPEITSAHLNFRDRDSHFIFGDACTAVVLETEKTCQSSDAFEILSTKLLTQFSNNIRNNFGFLNRTSPTTANSLDKLFMQQGRQVFKEVTPMAAKFILEHLSENHLNPTDIRRFWLHQANLNMNQLIAQKILGKNADPDLAPTILDEYANTASAGSLIAFVQYHQDFKSGDIGLLSSFGAGYSIGSILLKKL
ncbi:MAG: 3-oxoacyl-ACP synthase [Gammaproteobacteria bacterium]|jgi:beta-ketodecanoyl-[acyl-carrier-protein] synthase|nr:3-oxoacyl-ACP synthase [Gammaproteobacteria bacterium]